jgi:hypothetical protein
MIIHTDYTPDAAECTAVRLFRTYPDVPAPRGIRKITVKLRPICRDAFSEDNQDHPGRDAGKARWAQALRLRDRARSPHGMGLRPFRNPVSHR